MPNGITEPLSYLYMAFFEHVPMPDWLAIQLQYFMHYGRFANLTNPRTLNEKTNWRKLYQRDPRFTVFADKVAVKEEAAKFIGQERIIPNLWVGENPDDIPYERLRPPYVIKVNHGYGSNIFIRKEQDINRGEISRNLRSQLKHAHGRATREWCYKDIPRKILIEPMIETPDGGVPVDYKFFVYRGRVHFVQLNFDRYVKTTFDYVSREWERLPVKFGHYPHLDRDLPKPESYDEMVAVAEQIGALFDFVRVDLYQNKHQILLGEITFYHGAGMTRLHPEEWEYKFGDPWILDENVRTHSENQGIT